MIVDDARFSWRGLLEGPRNNTLAVRAGGLGLAAAGFLITIQSSVVPEYLGDMSITVFLVAWALFLAGVWFLFRPRNVPPVLLVFAPFIAVAAIVYLNYTTADTTIGSHLFAFWPVLYAAMFLRPLQCVAVITASCAGEAWVLYSFIPQQRATSDVVAFAITMAIMSAMVMLLRRREYALRKVLETQAFEDQLTGLPNRRSLDVSLDAALARRERSGAALSLLTIDVDRFKETNDVYGHTFGDNVLKTVGSTLRRFIRGGDFVARLGGDEFIAVLHDCDQDAAIAAAEHLREQVIDATDGISISIGVATTDNARPMDREALVQASDRALYVSKRAGRNRVSLPPTGPDPEVLGGSADADEPLSEGDQPSARRS